MAKTTLGTGAHSYAGQFRILAVADHDACPDLDVFTAAAQEGLHALAAATQDAPAPETHSLCRKAASAAREAL